MIEDTKLTSQQSRLQHNQLLRWEENDFSERQQESEVNSLHARRRNVLPLVEELDERNSPISTTATKKHSPISTATNSFSATTSSPSPSKQRYFRRSTSRGSRQMTSFLTIVKTFFVFFMLTLASIFLFNYFTFSPTRKNSATSVIKKSSSKHHQVLTTPRVVLLRRFDDVTRLLPTTTVTSPSGEGMFQQGDSEKAPKKSILYETRQTQFPINALEPNECEPFAKWQSELHPTCNQFHELDFCVLIDTNQTELVGLKGSWRHAWRLEDSTKTVVALKTLRFEHEYDPLYYEYNRVDAVAMEHLTSSPFVMDIYAACGNNAITEYATQSLRSYLTHLHPVSKLILARDIVRGMVHIHYSSGDNNVTLVHNDINAANIMMKGSTPKFNDFNLGIFMMWNKVRHRPCRFRCDMDNAQWRSPEEMKQVNDENSKQPLTEKTDIYALGSVFYKIITNHDPWLEYYNSTTKILDERRVEDAKRRGETPLLPPSLLKKKKKGMRPIHAAMLKCMSKLPQDRPTAKELLMELQTEVDQAVSELLASTKNETTKSKKNTPVQ